MVRDSTFAQQGVIPQLPGRRAYRLYAEALGRVHVLPRRWSDLSHQRWVVLLSAGKLGCLQAPIRGADRAAFMATRITTAKLHDVDPQAWLADVLSSIADTPGHTARGLASPELEPLDVAADKAA